MRELKLKYKSKEIIIQVPGGWHELTAAQFVAAAQIYIDGVDDNGFLRAFYGLNDKILQHLTSLQKYKLIELVEFVQDARAPHSAFFLQELPGTGLYAPGARLDSMCLQQFMMVDTFFSKYVASEEVEHLDAMIAYLYLGENERFVLSDCDKNVALLDLEAHLTVARSLDFSVKYAILLNFILIKRWLGRAYVHLFPSSEESSSENGKQIQTVKWLDIFDSFVGENIPYMDKYQSMVCTDAFRVMNRKIREAKKK